MYRGATRVTLDAKGRMVIPTRHREALSARGDGRVVVTVHPMDKCLLLYGLPDWDEVQARFMVLPSLSEKARRLQRLLVGHATDVELDGHGRLLLTPELRDYAHLDRHGMLVGQGNRFELWDEARWGEWRDQSLGGDQSLADGPSELDSLSL